MRSYTDASGTVGRLAAPQMPGLVAPYDPRMVSAGNTFTANQGRGVRVVVPRTGTLTDLSVYIVTSSGNIDVAVYDTTGTTRNRLWSSGSVACPAANAWTAVGNPGLSVTIGQQLDLTISVDNITASIGRCYGNSAAASADLPASFWTADDGAFNLLSWQAAAVFPLPATLAEASMAVSAVYPCLIARIA